jgi:hypothetical protein
MSLILSGTDGLSDVDGTAATPAIRGTDANTGIFFPAADTIAFSEGGAEAMRINSSGYVGIGTTNPIAKLSVSNGGAEGLEISPSGGTVSLTAYNRSGAAYAQLNLTGTAGIGVSLGPSYITTNSNMSVTNIVAVGGATPASSGSGITFPATQSASSDANTLDDYEEGTWTPAGNGVTYTGVAGKYTKIGDFVFCAYALTFPSTSSSSVAEIQGLPFPISSSQPRGTGLVSETNCGVNPIMLVLSGSRVLLRDADNNDRPNSAFSSDFLNGMIIYRV